MKIQIRLSKEDVREIVTAYVLKEVPVHTAGKDVFVTESYGEWEVAIEDKLPEGE